MLTDHSRDGDGTLVGDANHDYLIGGARTNRFKPGGGAVSDADPTLRGQDIIDAATTDAAGNVVLGIPSPAG